jgi:hypothetical protein
MRRFLLLYNSMCINRADIDEVKEKLQSMGIQLVEVPFQNHNSFFVLAYLVDLDNGEVVRCSDKS